MEEFHRCPSRRPKRQRISGGCGIEQAAEDRMMTRREFGATLAAGAAVAASAQSARPQPAAKRMIVDAQVHLWKANSPDWPWEPGVKPQLPEPFTIERLVPMMDEAGGDRVRVVPPGADESNDYTLEAALPCASSLDVL